MKGFIEVTQNDETRTLLSVKEIKLIEDHGEITVIGLNLICKKKQIINGSIFVKDTYTEVLSKIKEAIEKNSAEPKSDGE